MPHLINGKRIAKNTIYMYVRMTIVMLVQIYTSRVVLANLGIENYGIYNVVSSLIIAFTFMQGPLSTATQRFINVEIGKENSGGNPNMVFNVSLYVHLALAVLLIVALESGGQWFIANKMQIPQGREAATQFAFHISLLSLALSIIRTPFYALIVANERFSFYAILGVLEVVLKLLNAISLSFFGFDKLKIYVLNHLAIDLILSLVYVLYTKRYLPEYRFCRAWDTIIFKGMVYMTGWGLLGSFTSMAASQGTNMILNMFCGVAINASMGIATQVNGAVVGLASNFQVAFRPQIMKSFAAGEIGAMNKLLSNASKFSYLLIFFGSLSIFAKLRVCA